MSSLKFKEVRPNNPNLLIERSLALLNEVGVYKASEWVSSLLAHSWMAVLMAQSTVAATSTPDSEAPCFDPRASGVGLACASVKVRLCIACDQLFCQVEGKCLEDCGAWRSNTASLRIWTLRIWVLCGNASHPVLDHFYKHLSSVFGRTKLCRGVEGIIGKMFSPYRSSLAIASHAQSRIIYRPGHDLNLLEQVPRPWGSQPGLGWLLLLPSESTNLNRSLMWGDALLSFRLSAFQSLQISCLVISSYIVVPEVVFCVQWNVGCSALVSVIFCHESFTEISERMTACGSEMTFWRRFIV